MSIRTTCGQEWPATCGECDSCRRRELLAYTAHTLSTVACRLETISRTLDPSPLIANAREALSEAAAILHDAAQETEPRQPGQ